MESTEELILPELSTGSTEYKREAVLSTEDRRVLSTENRVQAVMSTKEHYSTMLYPT